MPERYMVACDVQNLKLDWKFCWIGLVGEKVQDCLVILSIFIKIIIFLGYFKRTFVEIHSKIFNAFLEYHGNVTSEPNKVMLD